MSAPIKPWESGYGLQSSSTMQNVIQTPVGRLRMAPSVPPRPNTYGGTQYNSPYNSCKLILLLSLVVRIR